VFRSPVEAYVYVIRSLNAICGTTVVTNGSCMATGVAINAREVLSPARSAATPDSEVRVAFVLMERHSRYARRMRFVEVRGDGVLWR